MVTCYNLVIDEIVVVDYGLCSNQLYMWEEIEKEKRIITHHHAEGKDLCCGGKGTYQKASCFKVHFKSASVSV